LQNSPWVYSKLETENKEAQQSCQNIYINKEVWNVAGSYNYISREHTLITPKDIIVVVIIKTFSRRNHWGVTGKHAVIKPNVQKTNLETVVAHQRDQFARFRGDRLLIQEHEQPIQPFRCNAG
jgi:hypothetical protein